MSEQIFFKEPTINITETNFSGKLTGSITLAEVMLTVDQMTFDERYYTENEIDTLLLGKSDISHTHPDASDTVKGLVELATNAEVLTGTDVVRAVTPAGAANTYAKRSSTFLTLGGNTGLTGERTLFLVSPLNATDFGAGVGYQLYLDFPTLTQDSAPQSNDFLMSYDTSSSSYKRVSFANLLAISHNHLASNISVNESAFSGILNGLSPETVQEALEILDALNFWSSTNDGSGSGLDADLLDGVDGSGYALASHTHTLSNLTDANDLTVIEALSGTGLLIRTGSDTWSQRSIDQGSNVTIVNGNGILGNPTISVANASELTRGAVELATTSDVTTGTNTTKAVTPAGAAAAYVKLTDYEDADVLAKVKNVDGAASGLDADTVDGFHFNNFVLGIDYTGSNILSKLITVDGTGSGLDADVIDGIDSVRIVYGDNDSRTINRISISTALPSGFNQIDGNSGIGAPTGTWYHVITNRHTNLAAHYQMQIAGEFFDVANLYYRIISNGTPGSWAKIWHSLNDGSGSGLDSDTVDGAHYSTFRNVGCNVIRTSNEGPFGAGLQTTTFSGYLNNSGVQAYWDGGTALYATQTGWYLLTGAAQIAPTANTDNVGCGISVNGTLVVFNQQRRSSSTLAINANCATVYYMTAGQYIQLRPYAANTFNSVYTANYSPVLGLIYLGV